MLNQDTKRKIDSARDILVGKVPDPKAQVEQITTALIYKFMDDMDKGSQELGGKARFFTNGYEKYSWTKLIGAKLGGHERLDLYMEALSKLSLNPHIPQLFRDIFKDAFLPYRSPETLSLFLKEINGFTYEHSEDLGDAFEYLLSILGSQGDAGQFRTPRHIIDFIVAAVNPKKNETICDPACGTAGFLISAYKHILKQHDGKDDPERQEKPLTPDERKNLMDHFTGYDISPDMVRLSRVNLYLHGFPNPTIYEYDTLSSEEKWDESFDVMLANPPFMTPKGGIKPHKRFSVQANRAEVLFVDYMLEHLRPNGRAGIIVPEGIIFQSGNAYKQLRKKLVDDQFLFAVISLPAGIFKPYSGVKTSILIIDRELAKKSDSILFVKVDSDGYDLGAQRREIDKSDLPLALMLINSYKINIASRNLPQTDKLETLTRNTISIFVPKSKIRDLGDYYLTGERYKEINEYNNQKWPMVQLGDVTDLQNGYAFKSPDYISVSNTLNFRMSNIKPNGTVDIDYNPKYLPDSYADKYKEYLLADGDVVIAMTDMASDPKILGVPTLIKTQGKNLLLNQRVGKFTNIDTERIFIPFLRHILSQPKVRSFYRSKGSGGVQINIGKSDILSIKIPIPPIEVQKEIVEQIEVKQQAIEHAKAIIKNLERERAYFGQSLRKLKDVEWVELGSICSLEYGFTETAEDKGNARFVRITDIDDNGKLKTKDQKYINLTDEAKRYLLKKDDLIVARTGATYGKTAIFEESYPAVFASYLIKLDFKKEKMLPDFYWLFSQTDEYWNQAKKLMTGGGQQQFNANAIKKIVVPLVPLDVQKKFIIEVEKEQQIINANKQLIEIYKKKIVDVLSEI